MSWSKPNFSATQLWFYAAVGKTSFYFFLEFHFFLPHPNSFPVVEECYGFLFLPRPVRAAEQTPTLRRKKYFPKVNSSRYIINKKRSFSFLLIYGISHCYWPFKKILSPWRAGLPSRKGKGVDIIDSTNLVLRLSRVEIIYLVWKVSLNWIGSPMRT